MSGKVAKRNPHTGSRFDDFLKEEGIFEEVQAKTLKRALAEQLKESMQAAKLTKLDTAKKIGDQPLAGRPRVGSEQYFGSVGYADQSSARSAKR